MKNRALKITALSLVAVLLVAIIAAVSFVAAPSKTTEVTATADETLAALAKTTYTNPYITFDTEGCLVSAHRAGGTLAPENTLMAFQQCLKEDKGYEVDVLEFDLHLTYDNELILLHDDNFDRTSDSIEAFGAAEISPRNKTLAELKKLNLGEYFQDESGDYPYKGLRGYEIPDNLRVATLQEIFEYTEKTQSGLRYIIEIKDSGNAGRIAADKLHAELVARKMLDRVVVGTFNGDVTDYMDSVYPDFIRSAGIIEVLRIFLNYIMNKNMDEIRYEVLQVPYVSYFPFLGSKGFINYAHRYNIAVQFWTINDASQVQTLVNNGADCIMSDNPKMVYEKMVDMGKIIATYAESAAA